MGTGQRLSPWTWHLVNEQSVMVLREKPPTSLSPQTRTHSPQGNWPLPKTQDTYILAGAGSGPAPPGQPGRAGSPGEPSMGLTPRLGQDTPSLAEAQTGSVYRMSALFPLPHPPLPLESWGLGEGQAGQRERSRQPNPRPAPQPPSPTWLLGVHQPVFQSDGSPKHRWQCAF